MMDKTKKEIKKLKPRLRGSDAAKVRTKAKSISANNVLRAARKVLKTSSETRKSIVTKAGVATTHNNTMKSANKTVKGKIKKLKDTKKTIQSVKAASRTSAVSRARKVAGKAVKAVARRAGAIGVAYTVADKAISSYFTKKAKKISDSGIRRPKPKQTRKK